MMKLLQEIAGGATEKWVFERFPQKDSHRRRRRDVLKLSTQRNETETKQLRNSFETVLETWFVSVSFRCADRAFRAHNVTGAVSTTAWNYCEFLARNRRTTGDDQWPRRADRVRWLRADGDGQTPIKDRSITIDRRRGRDVRPDRALTGGKGSEPGHRDRRRSVWPCSRTVLPSGNLLNGKKRRYFDADSGRRSCTVVQNSKPSSNYKYL